MSLKVPLEGKRSKYSGRVGVIEKNKRHVFRRFMSEIDTKQENVNPKQENVNEGLNLSFEEPWQVPDDNNASISLSDNDNEEPEPKNYEDFENIEERVSQWNVFKRTPRANLDDASEYLKIILQVMKIILYLVFFPIMLGLVVLSKGSLLIAVSNILPHQQSDSHFDLACRERGVTTFETRCVIIPKGKDFQWISQVSPPCIDTPPNNPLFNARLCIVMHNVWAWCVFLMVTTPYAFTFIKSLWKIIFRRKNNPNMKILFITLCFETLHSIGLCLFVFIVLPNLDNAVQMSFIVLGLSLVPSCLKIIFRTHEESKKVIKIVLDILSAVVQLIVLVGWPVLIVFKKSQDKTLIWSIPLSLFLVSLRWWENYADRFHSTHPFKRILIKMNTSRTKLQLIASLWKVLITLLFMPVCMMLQHGKMGHETDASLVQRYTSVFDLDYKLSFGIISPEDIPSMKNVIGWVLLVHSLSSLLAYLLARSSAKILTQKICYALPLALSSFVMLALVVAGCETSNNNPCALDRNIIPSYLFYKCYNSETLKTVWFEQFWFLIPLFWISQLWTAWHIWFPNSEKLSPADRLFVYPLYDGVVLEQSLLHNRRRKDQLKKAKQRITQSAGLNNQASNVQDYQRHTDDFISRKIEEKSKIPFIYVCSTMWHETRSEMLSLLKSVFKLDLDQFARKEARSSFKIIDRNFYEFEAHIFFDNAFTSSMADGKHYVNSYVKTLVSVVNEAASFVHDRILLIEPPIKYATPYGGRLTYQMPGNNILVVHMKDSSKIRHKKRWSQVMYMYYFLSHNLWLNKVSWRRKEARAANIFLMVLDGDVGFEPRSILLLVDLLKRNEKVGAVCGRIHPTGSGPMVWYQKFEYALGHWMQKATENVIGCVLCAPGCFSMFRGLALMDENVMATYTTQSTEPAHYIQYDQGEDRWLCTLMLQQGYSIEYCAASDAFTSAPEGLFEFFKQRRRWMLSTMANILDLISSWKYVTKKNESISTLYILYHIALFCISIVGPGTILLMIIGAVHVVFEDNLDFGWAAILNIVPIFIFIVLCYTAPDDYQLRMATLLTGFYCLIQMLVLVGLVVQMAANPITFPSTIFFFFVTGTFTLAAFLHPQELFCLFHGFTYYLSIPTMYLLLSIYAFVNLHVVSWGTREDKIPESVVKQEKLEALKKIEAQRKLNDGEKTTSGFFNNIKTGLLGEKNQEKEGGISFNCGDFMKISCCLKEKVNHEYENIQFELNNIKYKLYNMDSKVNLAKEVNTSVERDAILRAEVLNVENNTMENNVPNKNKVSNTHIPTLNEFPPNTTGIVIKENIPPTTNTNQQSFKNSPPNTKTLQATTNLRPSTSSYTAIHTSEARDAGMDLIASTSGSSYYSDSNGEEAEWMNDHESLGNGPREHLLRTEYVFFEDLIKTYLYPLKKDKKSEEELSRKLMDLRNKTSISFLLINAIFVTVVLALQLNVEYVYIPWFVGEGVKVEPIGFMFMSIYGIIMVLQVLGMIRHRTGTFLHVMASTKLECFRCCESTKEKEEEEKTEDMLRLTRKMSKLVPCNADVSSSRFSTIESLIVNDDEPKNGRKTHKQIFNKIRRNACAQDNSSGMRLEEIFHRNLELRNPSGSSTINISNKFDNNVDINQNNNFKNNPKTILKNPHNNNTERENHVLKTAFELEENREDRNKQSN